MLSGWPIGCFTQASPALLTLLSKKASSISTSRMSSSIMSEMGSAMIGTGEATGERRAVRAAEAAIANPLFDDISMRGARGSVDLDHRRQRSDAV